MAHYTKYLDLPAEYFNKRNGFSIDIGGSLVKLAFIADKLDEHVQDGYIRVHMASFPQEKLDEALQYIKQYCTTPDALSQPAEVTTCGVGCHKYKKTINETLNIRCQMMVEMICFKKAFLHTMEHVPMSGLLYELPESSKALLQTVERGKAKSEADFKKLSFKTLPCLLLMLGSGAGFIQINENGTHEFFDGSSRCGRLYYGMGKILTEVKDFDELISLATSGNDTALDLRLCDTVTEEGVDNNSFSDDFTLNFGKVALENKDIVKKEDIARSLLCAVTGDIVQAAMLGCESRGLNLMFVCGSLPDSHEIVREEMMKHLIYRNAFLDTLGKEHIKMHFLKYGGYLGALGSLLTDLEK